MNSIRIISSSFCNKSKIPIKYTCDGKDISPQIYWDFYPEAKSYTLIMEDPDTPGGTFTHWIIYDIPSHIRGLPEGIPKTPSLDPWPFGDGARQGTTDFGTIGYGGPCPPPGKPHRYFFRLYGLDKKLYLVPGSNRKEVDDAMKDHIIGQGELMGIYER